MSYSSSLAHIYFSGYSVSLAALTTALLIFAYFKFVVIIIILTICILTGMLSRKECWYVYTTADQSQDDVLANISFLILDFVLSPVSPLNHNRKFR